MAKPELHYHACISCRERYPDACIWPGRNDLCGSCRQGRLSVHQLGIGPRDCCHQNLRVTRKDELKTYRLRGEGPWWICTVCCRQFGYDVRLAHA